MKTQGAFLYSLGLLFPLIVFMRTADAEPVIDVNPVNVSLVFTTVLEVNCSFSIDANTSLAAVVSLIIARGDDPTTNNFTELASINEFSPYKVNLMTSENITADGFLNDAGESFLRLQWSFPAEQQSGWYKCSAHGFDYVGRTAVLSDVDRVNFSIPEVSDYTEEIRAVGENMENILKTLNQYTASLGCSGSTGDAYVSAIEESLLEMNAFSKIIEKQMPVAEDYAEDLERKISDIGRSCQSWEFLRNSSLVYKDHMYCLSHSNPSTAEDAAVACNRNGGYLAEIDDMDEYHTIQAFLGNYAKAASIEFVMIAGSDAATEDHWVFPSTNQDVPFLDWVPGDPDGGASQNCLFLLTTSWRMMNGVCKNFKPSVRYLCEMTPPLLI